MNYEELDTKVTKISTDVEKVYNYLYNTIQSYNYKTNSLLNFLSAKKSSKVTEWIELKPMTETSSIYGSSVRRSFVCSVDGTMEFLNPAQWTTQTALINIYPDSGDNISIFKNSDNKSLNKNMTIISKVTIEKSSTFVQRQIVDVPLEFNYYSGGIEIELEDKVKMDFTSENTKYSKIINKLYITKDTYGDSLENIVLGFDSSKTASIWGGKFDDTVTIKIEYYRIYD